MLLAYLALWILFILAGYRMADERGREPAMGAVVGGLLGVLGLILIAAVPRMLPAKHGNQPNVWNPNDPNAQLYAPASPMLAVAPTYYPPQAQPQPIAQAQPQAVVPQQQYFVAQQQMAMPQQPMQPQFAAAQAQAAPQPWAPPQPPAGAAQPAYPAQPQQYAAAPQPVPPAQIAQ